MNTELTKLPEIAMHGPIEVSMTVHCIMFDGKSARLTLHMPPGRIPTAEELNAVFANALSREDGTPIEKHARLMTKPEFVKYITERDVGQAIPMPGNQDWEAPDA